MNLSDLKDVIRDLISQEVGGDEEDMGADLDGGDAPIDGAIDGPADEEEIDLEELLKELEAGVVGEPNNEPQLESNPPKKV